MMDIGTQETHFSKTLHTFNGARRWGWLWNRTLKTHAPELAVFVGDGEKEVEKNTNERNIYKYLILGTLRAKTFHPIRINLNFKICCLFQQFNHQKNAPFEISLIGLCGVLSVRPSAFTSCFGEQWSDSPGASKSFRTLFLIMKTYDGPGTHC